MSARRTSALEALLSRVLHYGGLVSALVLIVGLLLLILSRGADRAIVEQLRQPAAVSNVPPGLAGLVADAVRGQATSVILVGVLLLIATPVVRVVAAAVYFIRHRDRAFALISAIVLALLVVGFLMGRLSASRTPSRTSEIGLRLTL